MLARIWHGWTSPEQAGPYEDLLRTEVFPDIRARCRSGLERIDLLRRPVGDEIESVTIMWFKNQAALDRFTGGQGEAAYVPTPARTILARFDEQSRHYELRHAAT